VRLPAAEKDSLSASISKKGLYFSIIKRYAICMMQRPSFGQDQAYYSCGQILLIAIDILG